MSFAERLLELRMERTLTLVQLSALANVDAVALRRLESGFASPSFGTLLQLCAALGVGLAAFDNCRPPVDHRRRAMA